MQKSYLISLILFFSTLFTGTQAQNPEKIFKEILMHVDTSVFSLSRNSVKINNEEWLCFKFTENEAVSEVILYPETIKGLKKLTLLESGDFQIIDSLRNFDDKYRFKVRFLRLNKSNFLSFNFAVTMDTVKKLFQVKLFPVTHTKAFIYPDKEDLYIGEEKIIDIVSDNPENIHVNPEWTSGLDINYRISVNNGQLRLHLMPFNAGKKNLQLKLQTYRPYLDSTGVLKYDLPVINYKFNIKPARGRLTYLKPERMDITMDEASKNEGIDFQFDNASSMSVKKTYRIEGQESPGGQLIAEIFTKNFLTDDRVLCLLRLYHFLIARVMVICILKTGMLQSVSQISAFCPSHQLKK